MEAKLRDPARRSRSSGFERRYQGSGVYRCGRCGAHMIGAGQNRTKGGHWRRNYTCSAARHVARDVEHLDAYVDELVIGRLSAPDAAIVLGAPAGDDIGALHRDQDALRARLDDLTALYAAGDIDAPQLKRGTAELKGRLDKVEAQLAAARAASVVANVVLAGDDLRGVWATSPPDVRGQVIDTLMTVTVLPSARGRKPGGGYFDPSSIRIEWKKTL